MMSRTEAIHKSYRVVRKSGEETRVCTLGCQVCPCPPQAAALQAQYPAPPYKNGCFLTFSKEGNNNGHLLRK